MRARVAWYRRGPVVSQASQSTSAATAAIAPGPSIPLGRSSRASAEAWSALAVGSMPGAALAFFAAYGWLDERLALALFVPSFVGLNAMHMAATWSRVYLAPGFARERPIERIVVPFGLAAVALGIEAIGGAIALFGLQYYLSAHHAAMQNYGLVRATQRASGRRLGAGAVRLDQAACLLPLLAALAYRAREVSSEYDAAPLVAPPAALVTVLGVLGAAAVVALAAREAAAQLRGERVDLLGPAIVLLVTGTWVALIVAIEHPALPFFALASGHYVQYLWTVARAERPRAAALGALPEWLRARVHPSRSTLGHLAFLAALGATGIVGVTLVAMAARAVAAALDLRPGDAMPLAPWGAAMLAVNLHHYWLDHRIWRSRA